MKMRKILKDVPTITSNSTEPYKPMQVFVDSVFVVRCKDCAWQNTEACPMWGELIKDLTENDYCSFGKRK